MGAETVTRHASNAHTPQKVENHLERDLRASHAQPMGPATNASKPNKATAPAESGLVHSGDNSQALATK